MIIDVGADRVEPPFAAPPRPKFYSSFPAMVGLTLCYKFYGDMSDAYSTRIRFQFFYKVSPNAIIAVSYES